MNKEKAAKLIGQTVVHKKYGSVIIEEFTSVEEDKIRGFVEATGEYKSFILSSNFFENNGSIKFDQKFVPQKQKRASVKKEIDYDKYRNHPLVKKIDKTEKAMNKWYTTEIDDDDDDELEATEQ